MARPVIRRYRLETREAAVILRLFGTLANAHARLGLQKLGLSYSTFYRVIKCRPSTEEHVGLVSDAWGRFVGRYLKIPVAHGRHALTNH